MKGFIFFISLLLSITAYAEGPTAHLYGNYCQDDIRNYVNLRFGPEIKITKMFHSLSCLGTSHYVYFQVDACEGDIVGVFRGDIWQCLNAQSSQRIQLLNQVYTQSESCRRFIPTPEFPDLY